MNRLLRPSLVLASLALAACADSTPPPATPAPPAPTATVVAPAPAPPVAADPAPTTEGDVTIAWSRGMEIVVAKRPDAEFVAADLYVRGGTRNWTKDNAGIEDLALHVATTGGTQSLSKEAYSNQLAALGARIGAGAGNDYSSFSAKAPRASWDALFPIFVDTFLAPALPATEFEIAKRRDLSRLKHEMEDGDGRLWLLARKAVFAGHPYANRSIGSVESISAMQAGDLAPHLAKLRDTNRLVLVVVGDVDPAHVIDQATKAFAGVPRGPYVETPIPQLHFDAPHVSGDPFKLPTNYIQSTYAAPAWSDPDFAATLLGAQVLRNRVWDEVRTKRNLSYAPNAHFDYGRTAPFSVLYVTAVDPNKAMGVMFEQARRLGSEPVPDSEFAAAKALYLTEYAQGRESVDGQAASLGDAILFGNDWHLARGLADRVRALTPTDVEKAAQKWFTNVQTAIVGDPSKLDPSVVGAAK